MSEESTPKKIESPPPLPNGEGNAATGENAPALAILDLTRGRGIVGAPPVELPQLPPANTPSGESVDDKGPSRDELHSFLSPEIRTIMGELNDGRYPGSFLNDFIRIQAMHGGPNGNLRAISAANQSVFNSVYPVYVEAHGLCALRKDTERYDAFLRITRDEIISKEESRAYLQVLGLRQEGVRMVNRMQAFWLRFIKPHEFRKVKKAIAAEVTAAQKSSQNSALESTIAYSDYGDFLYRKMDNNSWEIVLPKGWGASTANQPHTAEGRYIHTIGSIPSEEQLRAYIDTVRDAWPWRPMEHPSSAPVEDLTKKKNGDVSSVWNGVKGTFAENIARDTHELRAYIRKRKGERERTRVVRSADEAYKGFLNADPDTLQEAINRLGSSAAGQEKIDRYLRILGARRLLPFNQEEQALIDEMGDLRFVALGKKSVNDAKDLSFLESLYGKDAGDGVLRQKVDTFFRMRAYSGLQRFLANGLKGMKRDYKEVEGLLKSEQRERFLTGPKVPVLSKVWDADKIAAYKRAVLTKSKKGKKALTDTDRRILLNADVLFDALRKSEKDKSTAV